MGIGYSLPRINHLPPIASQPPVSAGSQSPPVSIGHLPVPTGPRQFAVNEMGGAVSAGLRRSLDLAEMRRKHLGPNLSRLLGDVNPLDGAATPAQRTKMKSAMNALQLKVELAVVDDQGNLKPADERVLNEVYAPNFPAHEAISYDTILASLRDRKEKNIHLDGKRFTLCFTGVLPREDGADGERRPVAFAQGGTLHAGAGRCVNYAEYWATNKEFRGEGVLDVLMGFNSAVSMAAAKKRGEKFAGTCWEMEPIGTGPDEASRLYSRARAEIYSKKGGQVIMGVNRAGDLLPHHVQPDVTAANDSGPVPLHLVFRPHDPEAMRFDMRTLTHIGKSYDDYFKEWAKINTDNKLPGPDFDNVKAAATYKHKLADEFVDVRLVPANQSSTAMNMARDNPLIARTVAESFGISIDGKGPDAMDYSDPFVRLEISHPSAQRFELETAFAPIYKPKAPAFAR